MSLFMLISILFIFLCLIIVAFVLRISNQVNERLNQMGQSMQEANKIIGQSLSSTTNIFGNVKEQLGRLEATNREIYEIGKDISSLQGLLRAPKFRGQMAETLLENLLSQVLPKDYYQMQYRFRSQDTVDAIIRLSGRIVSIDAKFTLENFQKAQEATDEPQKNLYRKKFIQDVKNRVDEVASKYILPQENTYNFALMYIPAENIYYEVIVKEDLLSYCISQKVIPVSPNTFYAYLQVICMGLKGLKIEENAQEILKHLEFLSNEIERVKEDFNLLGTHLSNASRKYEDTSKRLDRFSDRLSNVQDSKQIDSK